MSVFRLTTAAVAAVVVAALAGASVLAQDGASPGGDKATYVGDKVCQSCHFKEAKSWKKTALAKSMKTLEPTTEADNKELFDKKTASGLDPAKDYTTDAKCLKCHTTGYGTDSGYPADMKADGAEARAKTFGSVSCEACHGPGSNYVKFKKETREKDEKATFTAEQLAKYGLTAPDEKSCRTCHEAGGPTKEEFKFAEAKEKTHSHEKK